MSVAVSPVVVLLVGVAIQDATPSASAEPPRLHAWNWPGAVTVSPRPLPNSTGAPLNTTLWFQIEPGRDAKQQVDAIDATTLRVTLDGGGQAQLLVDDKAGDPLVAGVKGRILPWPTPSYGQPTVDWLDVYLELAAPLVPSTRYRVAIEVRSKSGARLPPGSGWSFTTRAATDDAPILLAADVARTVHFDHRIFAGTLKPNFDTSVLFEQVPTYELLQAVIGPPPSPAAASLQRDWPLCGDYYTNVFFDGDPNLVRERETRIVVQAERNVENGRMTHWVLHVGDLPESSYYGITPGRPLSVDYPVGCEVLTVDRTESRRWIVAATDDDARTVALRIEPQSGTTSPTPPHPCGWDWIAPETPKPEPASPAVPGRFHQLDLYLKKLQPCGTPVYWFERLDHEWDLVHRRFGRRLVVDFDRAPCDLSSSGVPGRCSPIKDPLEYHEFVRAITSHLLDRYGKACLDFYWSVGNEPDLRPLFWEGSDAELFAFYDLTVDAVLRAFDEHGLPTDRLKLGGLELGALAARPDLLERFLAHCSPRAQDPRDLEDNFAVRDERLDGRRSKRVDALAAKNGGRGSPCTFVSLHEYKHAAAAIEQLQWARGRALEIDPDFYRDLAVTSFETDPDWNPTPDPATRSMFFGNGFYPAWAADWSRRAIAAAFDDPAFARHEALLTVWPLDRNFAGIPTLSSLVQRKEGDHTLATTTIPKDILHFLTLLGWMGTDYFLLAPPLSAAAAPSGSALSAEDHALDAVLAGFGASHGDELVLLVYGHDALDPQNRDARERAVTIALTNVPFAAATCETFALDASHASIWPALRKLVSNDAPNASSAPQEWWRDETTKARTPAEVASLSNAAALAPLAAPVTLSSTAPDAAHPGAFRFELALSVPSNGIRLLRLRRAP